ncbi:alpha/beta hydrolase [Candidatus Symbiobacter mobilis]|uniref:Esterase-like protein n=1 Tax=Candidatus Symbiobacter mobilis CR TaxID=946483 RepID=U5N832_9BURK|nr:esterase [Candidatus Symbiobacter mobilis]AGX87465.1 esterase-like protein [Candidatus Symbiobacter mobilis CR]
MPADLALLPCVTRDTGAHPDATVIWLHGLGADGYDFYDVIPELQLPAWMRIRFVFPHAPKMSVTVCGGAVQSAWYDIRHNDLRRDEDEAGISASAAAVLAWVEHEVGRGVPPQRIVLAGFSQGCAVVLYAGLRCPRTLAGIIGLSGYLPLPKQCDGHPANQNTPIFLAHGMGDTVVALSHAESSLGVLRRLGYSVEWKTYAMPHTVCAAELADIAVFLQRVLPSST